MKKGELVWQIVHDTLRATEISKGLTSRRFFIHSEMALRAKRPRYFVTQVSYVYRESSTLGFSWREEVAEKVGVAEGYAYIPEAMQFVEGLVKK